MGYHVCQDCKHFEHPDIDGIGFCIEMYCHVTDMDYACNKFKLNICEMGLSFEKLSEYGYL